MKRWVFFGPNSTTKETIMAIVGGGMSPISRGDMLQASLQALGMGQKSAAMRGAMLDLSKGDLLGFQKNMFESKTGFDPGKMNMAMMSSPFGCLRPMNGMSRLLAASRLGGNVHTGRLKSRRSFHTPFGTSQVDRRQLGGKGFFGRLAGRALESRLKRDPIFRAKFEAKVGGQFVPDGRNDGKVTVRRFKPNILGLAAGAPQALAGNLMAMGALGGLAMMQAQIANLVKGIAGQSKGQASGGLQGKEGSYVSKLGPNASFEDLVAAFMKDVMKDQQKEVKAKMAELNQLKANQKKGAAKSAKKRGKGGIGGFMKKIIPMATKGLGTAFFGPIGGAIGGIAGNALSGAMGSQSASGSKGPMSKEDYQDSRQMMMEELKNMMQKLQQMQQALSNVLNSMHQGAMNSIRNIRA
jgi:flagellar hook-basal body complex protein FliE